jgi:hypothetical protein
MWGAWTALQRQYAGLHCGVSLSLLFRVHQAFVPPVASYGCELWGFRVMPSRLTAARDKLATNHVNMLRQILGLRKSTPHAIVLYIRGNFSNPYRLVIGLLHLALPPGNFRIFFQFRSGCSGLPTDTGRRRVPFPRVSQSLGFSVSV